uniref:Uncharacterized protein n=1 Tax=Rhizophora mucronata TaxID=61149 RepID=A0A2P2QPW5_RHIMU
MWLLQKPQLRYGKIPHFHQPKKQYERFHLISPSVSQRPNRTSKGKTKYQYPRYHTNLFIKKKKETLEIDGPKNEQKSEKTRTFWSMDRTTAGTKSKS